MRYQVVFFAERERYAVIDTGLGVGYVRGWFSTATEADGHAAGWNAQCVRSEEEAKGVAAQRLLQALLRAS